MKETDSATVEIICRNVAEKKDAWRATSVEAKIIILEQIHLNLKAKWQYWVEVSAKGHGYDLQNPAHAHLVQECAMRGPAILANMLHGVLHTYRSIRDTGEVPKPLSTEKRSNGQISATVFPSGLKQTVVAGGLTIDIHCQPNEEGELTQTNPLKITEPPKVVAILAPGNNDACQDVLQALFMENDVAIFKPNPVNSFTSDVLADIFDPLVEQGFLGFISDSLEVGQALVQSPFVDKVMLTGNCATFDAIIWGSNQEKSGSPTFPKPCRAELGSVNPYIIVPGIWSEKALNAHASQVVAGKMFNAGHICGAPQVLITDANWPQREVFLKKIRDLFKEYPATRSFYPKSDVIFDEFVRDLLEETGKSKDELLIPRKNDEFGKDQLPILFAENVKKDSLAVRKESFNVVMAELPLDTNNDPKAFMELATTIVNDNMFGSLSATVAIDDTTRKSCSEAFEKMIDEIHVGSLGINMLGVFGVSYPQALWGAYGQGHPWNDIQSGQGHINNSYCIDRPMKTVLRQSHVYPGILEAPLDPVQGGKFLNLFAKFSVEQSWTSLIRLFAFVLTRI